MCRKMAVNNTIFQKIALNVLLKYIYNNEITGYDSFGRYKRFHVGLSPNGEYIYDGLDVRRDFMREQIQITSVFVVDWTLNVISCMNKSKWQVYL